jgi:hypothetical protein
VNWTCVAVEVDDPDAAVEFRDTDVATPEVPADVAIAAVSVVDFTLELPDDTVGTTFDAAAEDATGDAIEDAGVLDATEVITPDPGVVEDATTATVLEATADVTIAVPAFSHGEITHWEAKALSTYFPFCLEGVRLRV